MFIQQGKKGNNNLFVYLLTVLICISGFVSLAVFLMEQVRVDEQDHNQVLFLSLMPFAVVVVVIILNTAGLHRRSFASLFNVGGVFRHRRFLLAFALWMALLSIGDLAYSMVYPGQYVWHLDPDRFIKLVLVSLTLFPVQTLAEELMFRSYIPQGLSNLFSRSIFPIVISSALFMAVHLANPENEKFGYGLMAFYYFLSGLYLCLLTALDDGIEQSYGIHTATNIYGAVFVGYQGSALETDALWKIADPVGWVMVLTTFLIMLVYFLWSSKLFALRPLNSIFSKYDTSPPDEKEIP